MRVDELMTKPVATCMATDPLNRAAQIMWDQDCGCVPVLDEHARPIAMITDRDVCMAAYTRGKPLGDIQVYEAMSSNVVACRAEDSVSSAEALMRGQQIRRLPVVNAEGRIIGILSLNDIATHPHTKATSISPGRDELGSEAIAATLSAICTHASMHAAE